MIEKGFKTDKIDKQSLKELQEHSRLARGDILAMTTLAASGHPGGSMSSIDIYSTLYNCANIFPEAPHNPDRDRIIISHGHTSPGVYASLARAGFFNIEEPLAGFRLAGSIFEGHVERDVPGVEWATGNLGQGLSAGCGFALAAKLKQKQYHTFVVMGDGEQQKGQIAEARRFAAKYKLNNLTAIIDCNQLQISGNTKDVMPQNIIENFQSDGWKVMEIDGHDINQIYETLHVCVNGNDAPIAVIAKTTMGKGVSFMENKAKYHGVVLNDDQFQKAMGELSIKYDLEIFRQKRRQTKHVLTANNYQIKLPQIKINTGQPVTYKKDELTDNRSAFGNALKNLGELNSGDLNLAVFDCDLAGSVKTNGFQSVMPENFFESGIQEHNTATVAGAMSLEGIVTFFADFGVFGACETYNQHRLNDINKTNLKVVCTHVGLDVGEDGKTHQCIDYIGLFQNLFGFKVIIPADPNQTDRTVRHSAATPGNYFIGMGRSKLPLIYNENGTPFFGNNYKFQYGKSDWIRKGAHAVIMSYGCMLHRAVQASTILKNKGISVGVVNVSCPLCIDTEILTEAAKTGSIITYEDHNIKSGMGSVVADKIATGNFPTQIKKLGISGYGVSGKPDDAYKHAGLDVDSLVRAIEELISNRPTITTGHSGS